MKKAGIVFTFLAIFALTIPLTIVEANESGPKTSESSKIFKSEDRGNIMYKGSIPYFEGTKYLGWVDSVIEDRLLVSRYKTDEDNNLAYCLNWDLESPDFAGNEYEKSNEKITSKEYSAVVYGYGGAQDVTGEYTIHNNSLTNDQRYYVTQVTTYVLSDDFNSKHLTLDSLIKHDGKYEEVQHSSEMLDIIKRHVSFVESNLLSVPEEEVLEVAILSEEDNQFKDKGLFYETDTLAIEQTNEKGKLSVDQSEFGEAYPVDHKGNVVEEAYVVAGNEFKLRIDKQDILEDQAIKLSVVGEVSYSNVHKYIPADCELGKGGTELQRILWIGDEVNTAEDHLEFEINKPLLDINITKVDEHHELLDGATFSLVNAAGEVMAEEQAQDGRLIFSELTSGPYTIIETEIPEGYTTSEAGNEVEVELVNEHVDITVVNERIKGSLEILKTDIVDDAPLPDTTFQIKDEAGDVIVEGKTDENGIAQFLDLSYGKYTYQEVEAPIGYVIDTNPYPFEIREDGEVIKAEMNNRLIEGILEITKTDLETGEPLQGVEFTVFDESGDIVVTETTNESGVIVVDGLTYGKYSVQETEARQGYHLDNRMHPFEIVNDSEKIQLSITNEKLEQAAIEIISWQGPNTAAGVTKEIDAEKKTEKKKGIEPGIELETDMTNRVDKIEGENNAMGPIKRKENVHSGGRLPDTATNNFNMIGIGLLLMMSGITLYAYFSRKSKQQ